MNELIGQVEFNNIILSNSKKSIDLTSLFVSYNIYEDLFSPFKTGKIVVKDTQDIQDFFPIVGGENIEINYKTANDKSNSSLQNYRIYKLEKDQSTISNLQVKKLLIIYFCSPEMLTNQTKHISKRMKGTSSSVISECINKFLMSPKTLNNDGNSPVDFMSNFWTPLQVINYISKLETNPNFMFFENRYGLNYKPLDAMLYEKVKYDLSFEDSQASLYGYNNILQYKFEKYFNDFESTNLGVTGNTFYGVDKTFYNYKKVTNTPTTSSKESTSLGRYSTTPTDLHNSGIVKATILNPESQSLRELILKNFLNYHLVVKMRGDSNKTVGELCNIPIRSMRSGSIENNKILEGTWLISKINHEIINGGKYIQNMKLIKNAVQNYSGNMLKNVEGKVN